MKNKHHVPHENKTYLLASIERIFYAVAVIVLIVAAGNKIGEWFGWLGWTL